MTQVVLQVAHQLGLVLLPESLHDIGVHPLLHAQQAQISVGTQPFRKRSPLSLPSMTLLPLVL